jgi:hypothetical protein
VRNQGYNTMAVSGVAGSGFHAMGQQSAQSVTAHMHPSRHSLTDIDTTGSSVASTPSATGKIGSKVNITA